jgi:hypothetical protein
MNAAWRTVSKYDVQWIVPDSAKPFTRLVITARLAACSCETSHRVKPGLPF